MYHKPPANIYLGQEVFIARPGSWDTDYQLGTVKKVTPTRQVTVTCRGQDRRFTANGHEVGGHSFRSAYLAWNVEEIKVSLAEGTRLRKVQDSLRLAANRAQEFQVRYGAEAAGRYIAEARALLDQAEAALKAD